MSFKMSSSKSKRSKTSPNSSITLSSYSAEKIAHNDGILMEILLRLPVKSLLRFKSVSKHWLSLISNPDFSRRQYPNPVSGLFLKRLINLDNGWCPEYNFVNLNKTPDFSCKPFRSLTFVDEYRAGIRILQSCNGLLLCCTSQVHDLRRSYYVYNPATKQHRTILTRPQVRRGSVNSIRTVYRMILAFDPSKSPHYKVVCVRKCNNLHNKFQIEIYSSETRCWRPSSVGTFSAFFNYSFDGGVFWNGSVHWISSSDYFLYFKVDEEQLCGMPMPIPQKNRSNYHGESVSMWNLRYFGESRDHLHLIYYRNECDATHFNVYEMERDYSRWFVKYRFDPSDVSAAFPEMIPPRSSVIRQPALEEYFFSVLCVVRVEIDEDSYLVLNIPGKVLRYNFRDGTFYVLCEIEPAGRSYNNKFQMDYWPDMMQRSYETYQYIESLASV